MPLLVHCPNRCQIRVPSNRMGKVIRCVDCQAPIIIPEVQSPLLRTGNWVECRAKRAIKKTEISNAYATNYSQQNAASDSVEVNASVSPVQPVKTSTESSLAPSLPLVAPTRPARLLRAKPWRTVEPLTSVDPEDVLTPIDLDDTRSPDQAPDDLSDSSEERKPEVDDTCETTLQQPHKLSLISRLLWFVNPFAKGRRSA